jgi:tetratricopeptide (TPR) repeat protein
MCYLILPSIIYWWILQPSQRAFTKREQTTLAMLRVISYVAMFSPNIAILFTLYFAYGGLVAYIGAVANFLVLYIFLRLFNKSLYSFPQYYVNTALADGDYDEALRRTQLLETKYAQALTTLYYRGTVLLFAGKYSEAESFLRQCLPEAMKANKFQAEVLTNLGYALMRQGRYDEATRMYEAVLKLNPMSGHGTSGLAEVYLFQGIEPQKALDIIVQFMKVTPKRRVRDKSTWGAIRGDEAWALALLGRYNDAREAIGLAFEMTDKSFNPGVASLRYKEGKVFQIHGDPGRATKSFSQAIQLDPDGAMGQLARQALAEMKSAATSNP